ncbi:MAG: twitching motility protein PilT [Spirochaetes bacterium]|nr:twitching motility protein PilT [Spirochaetota bacterium]
MTVVLHGDLDFFVRKRHGPGMLTCTFQGRRSVKDLVESLGIPHVEVNIILAEHHPVDFSYLVRAGDRLDVYPLTETPPIQDAPRLIPPFHDDARFVLDVHLRKLSRYLRLLGFDVLYDERLDDRDLAEVSTVEDRILLTRDRRLLMRSGVSRGYTVRDTHPPRQVVEVLQRFSLRDLCRPFTRCLECNGRIESMDTAARESVAAVGQIPPGVLSWCREFYRCSSCRRIYWKGSHYERLTQLAGTILSSGELYE